MVLLPLEILLSINGALLGAAAIAGLVLMRASVKYQRNLGDNAAQREHVTTIVNSTLFLILLGVLAAGLNLFSLAV
jgi:hypothetical protein